ncbi:MAG TPA: hypothetical protein VLW85_24590 [Myxococcales bacterium]|nr:hypothetical protein [Myxococcales bacterium]
MKTRALRLQLQHGRLEGLLAYHVPAAAAVPYEAAIDLRVALAPAALEGLALQSERGVPLPVKVAEASVSRNPDGSLDASFLLEPLKAPPQLRVSVEEGPPLPVTLIAETGVKLSLVEGPGAPVRGGLSLRPRRGLPCLVQISVAAKEKPR